MFLTCATALGLTLFLWLDVSAPRRLSNYQDRGCQVSSQPEAYLSLAIRMSKKGSIHIVRTSVVNGKLIQPNMPMSDYLYEVAHFEETLAVGFLRQDSFIARGFAALRKGEKVEAAESVTLVLNFPLFAKPARCNLKVRFYKIKPHEGIKEIDAVVFQRLKAQQRLSLEFEIPTKKLRNAICKKAR